MYVHEKTITQKNDVFRFLESYESKKCVKNDTFFIKNYNFLNYLNDEPGVSKYMNLTMFLCHTLSVSPLAHQFDSYISDMTKFL